MGLEGDVTQAPKVLRVPLIDRTVFVRFCKKHMARITADTVLASVRQHFPFGNFPAIFLLPKILMRED